MVKQAHETTMQRESDGCVAQRTYKARNGA